MADLEQVKQVIRDYHFALDLRQNGGQAAWHAVEKLEKIFDMPWKQGDELRQRGIGTRALKKADADTGSVGKGGNRQVPQVD